MSHDGVSRLGLEIYCHHLPSDSWKQMWPVVSGRYSVPLPNIRSLLDSTDEALRVLLAIAAEANTWPVQRSVD